MLFIKGLIIGIGKIIPGVSGSLLAITLGEYENMLYSVNNFFKDISNNTKYLFKICMGILTSILLFSNIIAKSINTYYIYTMFLFAGFIIGSSDEIKKDIKINHIIVIISLLVVLLINIFILNNNLVLSKNFAYYVFGGFIDAITMIIPGISGTAMLISYGCYNEVILSLSKVNLDILFPFATGMMIGILLTIKFISYMFNFYKNKMYSVILGISISTIFIMTIRGLEKSSGVNSILISLVLLIIGYIISKKMTAILAVK